MKIAVSVSAVILLLGITVAMFSGDAPEIQARSVFDRVLVIENTGTAPITITNVLLNDRDDCSIEAALLPYKLNNLTREQLRQAFVFGWTGITVLEIGRMGNLKINNERILRVGESARFALSCDGALVRASIWTNQGTASYTFNRNR